MIFNYSSLSVNSYMSLFYFLYSFFFLFLFFLCSSTKDRQTAYGVFFNREMCVLYDSVRILEVVVEN